MKLFIKIFFWGAAISFLGALPLGTMNVTATNISVADGTTPAFIFALGTLVVEAACVYIVLFTMQCANTQKKLFRIFEFITIALILILAFSCFLSAIQMKRFGETIFTSYNFSPFVLGLLLSALNPLHIPFWFGWSTVLINQKILIPKQKYFYPYLAGISVGTIAGFDVFIFGGKYVVHQLNDIYTRPKQGLYPSAHSKLSVNVHIK